MILEMFVAESEYLLHVILALILGFIIGIERKIRHKEAGMRTHAIVCGGGLMTIVSKYGFGNSADAFRVAAQIVNGIGF